MCRTHTLHLSQKSGFTFFTLTCGISVMTSCRQKTPSPGQLPAPLPLAAGENFWLLLLWSTGTLSMFFSWMKLFSERSIVCICLGNNNSLWYVFTSTFLFTLQVRVRRLTFPQLFHWRVLLHFKVSFSLFFSFSQALDYNYVSLKLNSGLTFYLFFLHYYASHFLPFSNFSTFPNKDEKQPMVVIIGRALST